MNPVSTLYKVFRANFEMPLPKKGTKAGIYLSLGIIAISCIMIPCCIIVGYLSYMMSLAMMVDGNKVNGLISEMHIISAFSMMFGMAVVFNVLYFSSDREHMVTLPLKSWQLLAAKFRHTFMAESVMEFLVLFSMFFGYLAAAVESYGVSTALSPIAILSSLIATFTTPLLPLIYCTILSLLLAAILKKVRSARSFYRSSAVVIILFLALFLYSFKDMGGITVENYVSSMVADNNLFLRVCNLIFFTTPLICNAIAEGNLLSLLLYLIGNAAAVGIMLLLAMWLYQEGLYTTAALGDGKRKIEKGKLNLKLTSVFFSYIAKEWKVLSRTRAYLSNCILINFLWPIGLAVLYYFSLKNDSIKDFLQYYHEGNERARLIIFLAVIVVSFIASALNTLSTTAFSREGAHVDLIKYIPVSYKTQMYAKACISLGITAPFLILTVILAGILFHFPPFLCFCYILLALEALLLATVLGLAMDSASPYTLWEDEYSALRGNLNSFFSMALIMVISVLFCGLAFLLYEIVQLPLIAVHLCTIVLLAITDTAALIFGRRIILANMKELY